MLFHVEKYANAEEALSARKISALGPSDKGKDKEREKKKRKREEPLNNDSLAQARGSLKSSTPRFHNYTFLNALQSKILMEIQDQLPPARWMYTPPARRNRNKHCRYHREHDHNIDEFL